MMKLQKNLANQMNKDSDRKWTLRIKQPRLGDQIYFFFALILQCLCVPVLYIQLITLVYELRYKSVDEMMTASNSFWWKQIAVNCWLALTLTLKMASFAPSLNFLDTFVGIAFYAFFSGNFNTDKDTWDKTQACYEKTHALKDVIEN